MVSTLTTGSTYVKSRACSSCAKRPNGQFDDWSFGYFGATQTRVRGKASYAVSEFSSPYRRRRT
jgi:hypothetical protein